MKRSDMLEGLNTELRDLFQEEYLFIYKHAAERLLKFIEEEGMAFCYHNEFSGELEAGWEPEDD